MTTSDQILDYLTHHRSATVMELSRALDLTKADIHYHMRKLLSEEAVKACEPDLPRGAGRPARSFQLVENAPLKLNRLVVSVLLTHSIQPYLLPGENKKNLADQFAIAILSCCPSFKSKCSPAVKLNNLVDELGPLGFAIRWEASKKGPQIYFTHESLSLLIDNTDLVNEIMTSLLHEILKVTA